MAYRTFRADARPGRHLRHWRAGPRYGSEGFRADDECRHPARHSQSLIRGADAHWGYGFPIGGVAAFDPAEGGVVSAGGVGFDVSCGVRTMLTGLTAEDAEPAKTLLADALFRHVPVGVGSRG